MSEGEAGIGIGGLGTSKNDVSNSAFDLFSPIEIDTSITDSVEVHIRPITASNSSGPYEFVLPADPYFWTGAETFRLTGKVRLRKVVSGTTTNLGGSEDVSVINNFYHSLFRSVAIRLNSVDLNDPSQKWYPYKSYLETLLSYSQQTKSNRLKANCFAKDTAGAFDVLPTVDGSSAVTAETTNDGYKQRRSKFVASRWSYFAIPLHTDLTTLRRHIPPNIKIELNLERTSDAFLLMNPKAATTIKIVIDELVLHVRRFKPQKKIQNYFDAKLAKIGKCFLPIDRSLIKTYTVAQGTYDMSHYNLLTGPVLPDQVIVGVVSEVAYNGNIAKSPYNFQNMDISEISLVVNGKHEPDQPYKIDINRGDYIHLYDDFMVNSGVSNDDRDLWITPEDFIGGNFLVIFDRSFDKCNRYHRHPTDSGSIDINIKLRTATTATMVFILPIYL